MCHPVVIVSALAEFLFQLFIELLQLVAETLLDWILRKRDRK
jgi:hypothetical protein